MKKMWIDVIDENDKSIEIEVDSVWEICKRCDGEGSHGNPAFDGMSYPHGADPEFWEGYFSGKYDVKCNDCGGSGKVRVPDFESQPEWVERGYYKVLDECKADRQIQMMESRHLF